MSYIITDMRVAYTQAPHCLIDVHHTAFQAAYQPLAKQFDSDFVSATNQNYFNKAWRVHFANDTHHILGLWQKDSNTKHYNQLVGFCCYGPANPDKIAACDVLPDINPTTCAELYQIYLLPQARGHGTGKALIQLMRANIKELGYTQMLIDVYTCNQTAIKFYEKLGAELARSEFLDSETRQGQIYHNPSAHYIMNL